MGFHQAQPARRGGAVGSFLIVVVLAALVLGGCAMTQYNGIVSKDETVKAAWADVNNQYKRRFDLIPQLVETVKGAADFEKSTITAVTEARASVGQMKLDSLPEDPAKIKQFFDAQDGLGSALSRLLVAVEAYPDLKATANFQDLQTQIEGTENRIAVARNDYIQKVNDRNIAIRKFPGNLVAGMFGYQELPQLEAEVGVTERPEIDFGGDE